jgi:iron(III) transport system substrate-binding protein
VRLLAALLILVLAGPAAADGTSPDGADREHRLMADSRAEGGELLWYSSLDIDRAILLLLTGFRAKYDWVTLGYRSEDRESLLTRWREDAPTGVPGIINADVQSMKTLQGTLKPLKADRYWEALCRQAYVVAYNRELVAWADVPLSYEDLLEPKWIGRLGISASQDGGPTWLGAILQARGDREGLDYLTRLAGQNVRSYDASPRAVLDLVSLGSLPIAVAALDRDVESDKRAGQPVDWIAPAPLLAVVDVVGVAAATRHPATALLFIDYLTSAEGQEILARASYTPHRNVTGWSGSAAEDDTASRVAEWSALYRDLFTPERRDGAK